MQDQDQEPIYLDHNATTPLAPEVREAMRPFLEREFGNPSSPYPLGARAKSAVEEAREKVASLLACKSQEILFTSGGSEANNTVLKGVIDFRDPERHHIITSSVEHPAILNPCLYLMQMGVKVTFLPVDRFGRVDPQEIRKAIRPDTKLISIMLANNETGTLQPIQEISKVARDREIPFHTDAAQAVGKIPVEVDTLGVDFLSLAGHKLYGPKGVGALFIRAKKTLTPLIHGAGQEQGRRAGTENVLLDVGLGAACELASRRLPSDYEGLKMMRDRLEDLLFQNLEGLVLNGHPKDRLPNTLNVSVPGVEGAEILNGLPAMMASTGAACHDRSVKLSHVLSAMAVPPEIGMGALRLSLGRSNSPEQIERAAEWIIHQVKRMRNGNQRC